MVQALCLFKAVGVLGGRVHSVVVPPVTTCPCAVVWLVVGCSRRVAMLSTGATLSVVSESKER